MLLTARAFICQPDWIQVPGESVPCRKACVNNSAAAHTGLTPVQAMSSFVCKLMSFVCRETFRLPSDDMHVCMQPCCTGVKRYVYSLWIAVTNFFDIQKICPLQKLLILVSNITSEGEASLCNWHLCKATEVCRAYVSKSYEPSASLSGWE